MKAAEVEFKFGKYKGKTIEEVSDENPDYLEWIVDNFDDGFIKDKIVEFLDE